MKKRIVTLWAICGLLLCTSACSIPDIFSSGQSGQNSSSDVTSNITSSEGSGGNSDTSEHVHTSEWVAFETCHQLVYTCGCPYPDIAEMHIDSNHDNVCDVCEYTLGSTPTPTNHFLRNQAGAEWLQVLTVEDVAEVKLISQAVGVAPGSLKTIQSSTDMAAISDILEEYRWLDTSPIAKENGAIDGGGAMTVQFILTSGTVKELYINNGNYCDSNGNYFELLYTPTFGYTENYVEYYGFINYTATGTVWEDGVISEPSRICEIAIDDLEFGILNEDVNIAPTEFWYTVNTEFGNLRFLSNCVFYNTNDDNRLYYNLVGKNLDELIEEALSPDYSITMNDADWLWEDLQPTYKAGETVSVKIGMALDVGFMFLVNGEKGVATCNDVDGLYWDFTFTMPAEDVVIDFKTYDGMLPDMNYGILIETYWLQNLDAEWVRIRCYYGEFESGAIVAMIEDSGGYTEAEWAENVDGTVIHYNDGNRIIVLYNEVFYTLTEAYEHGYITAADLAVIAELQNR